MRDDRRRRVIDLRESVFAVLFSQRTAWLRIHLLAKVLKSKTLWLSSWKNDRYGNTVLRILGYMTHAQRRDFENGVHRCLLRGSPAAKEFYLSTKCIFRVCGWFELGTRAH